MDGLWTLVVIQGIVMGAFCGYIATQKNKLYLDWFILGLIFSILALIAIAAVPKEDISAYKDNQCQKNNIRNRIMIILGVIVGFIILSNIVAYFASSHGYKYSESTKAVEKSGKEAEAVKERVNRIIK